jgi:ribosomal protein S18 acetylase RimI-like enzyme
MLWLRIEPRADGPHAFGFDFQVRPELRRRGYGRAIMLAAERECRVRGVASVGLNVFGRNLGAHSLYEQLGFEATAIQMTKRLSGPVETTGPGRPDERVQLAGSGAGVRLEPMTEAQYAVYLPFAQQDYARNIARSGAMSEAAAVEKAAEDFARRHSAGVDGDGGVDQPGRLLFTAYDGAAEVGMVGLRLEERTDGTYAFGFDFRVEPELRRRGYGRAIMLAAERVCRDRGVVSVGLSVFGFNRGAQSLYEQLGFEVSAIQMIKRL